MSDIKIMPCPFCGGKPIFSAKSDFGIKYEIKCSKCAAVKQYRSFERSMAEHTRICLIRDWNNRDPEERLKERITEAIKMPFDAGDYDKGWNDALEMVRNLLNTELYKEYEDEWRKNERFKYDY